MPASHAATLQVAGLPNSMGHLQETMTLPQGGRGMHYQNLESSNEINQRI